MSVTILVTNDAKRRVISEVLEQYFKFKPQEARAYFAAVKRFHDHLTSLTTGEAMSDGGTLLYCAKIPADVLRNIQFNIPEFMANSDIKHDQEDLSLFFDVASELVFRPRASGIAVPERARTICHRSQ